jgi:hypothetical protein
MLTPGGRVHLAPVAAPDPTLPRHDPAALADALGAVLAELDARDRAGGPADTSAGFGTRTGSQALGVSTAPDATERRRSQQWR